MREPATGPGPRWPLALTALALLALAWANRFVLDDAFISYRYAAHAAAGHGLVWNPGEWVEGYTNFLWTWLLSVALRAGLEPVLSSQLLGLACHLVTLTLVGAVGRRLLGSTAAGLAAQVALGCCYTFSAYGTSGLETAMQAMWPVVAAALLVLRPPDAAGAGLGPARALLLSLALAAAVMTRLDSAVLAGWVGMAALVVALRAPRSADRWVGLGALALPFALVVGAWLAWKVAVYGELLPNTFYAKAASEPRVERGLAFVASFASSYLLLPALLLAAVGAVRGWRRLPRGPLATGAAAVASWVGYVAWVGGDFMEFRFLVAALPFAYLLLIALGQVALPGRATLVRAALVAWLVAGSGWHALTFEGDGDVESIPDLAAHLTGPVQDWLGVGRTLGAALGDDGTVRIATTAAGAIPYESGLPAVDMLGLTDAWIARHGKPFGAQLGHERVAPLSYLVAREVHLVLGQPWVIRPSPPEREHYRFAELRELRTLGGERAAGFPPTSSVVEIPLAPDRHLVALYLRPHPAVERLLAQGAWRRYRIVVESPAATL